MPNLSMIRCQMEETSLIPPWNLGRMNSSLFPQPSSLILAFYLPITTPSTACSVISHQHLTTLTRSKPLPINDQWILIPDLSLHTPLQILSPPYALTHPLTTMKPTSISPLPPSSPVLIVVENGNPHIFVFIPPSPASPPYHDQIPDPNHITPTIPLNNPKDSSIPATLNAAQLVHLFLQEMHTPASDSEESSDEL